MGSFRLSVALFFVVVGVSHANPFFDSDSSEHGQFEGPVKTTCKCGWTNKGSGRIVGGRETKENEYPHMVALFKYVGSRPFVFCGASIITPFHALTAAHCTLDVREQLYIGIGCHDTRTLTSSQIVPVSEHIEHHSYNPRTLENDISLLVLAKKLTFTDKIGPVCLPHMEMNSHLVGKRVKVTGWGTQWFRGPASARLLKVNLNVIPLTNCARQYNPYNPISLARPTQICTHAESKDACQGDSGGPVTWLDPQTNRYTLVGLVSFGKDCATAAPGVNTDVYAHMTWLKSNIDRTTPSYERSNVCTRRS